MHLLIIQQETIFLVRLIKLITPLLDKITKSTIIFQQIILQIQEYLDKTTTIQLTLPLVKITTIKVIISLKTIITVCLGRIITQEVMPYLMPAHKDLAFLGIILKLDRITIIPQSLAQIHKISLIINQIRCLINKITLLLQWLELEIILNRSYSKIFLRQI